MSATDPDRWREAVSYEFSMLGATLRMVAQEGALHNAISESRLLHARNLSDFCSEPWRSNDIKPWELYDDYDTAPEYRTLRSLIKDVETAYRSETCELVSPDGTRVFKSPQWAFNKKLAHLTHDRGIEFANQPDSGFDYQPFMDLVVPKLMLLAAEIRRLQKREHDLNRPPQEVRHE